MLLGEGGARLRIVDFGGIFAAAQVIVHVHAGANVFSPDHRLDGMHGGGRQFLVGIERRPSRWTSPREKRRCRLGVDDRNIFRPQAIDGARNQLRDGLLRFAGKRPVARFHDDSSFRFALLLAEQRLARENQVHAYGLDFGQSLQRAFEFSFESALVVHLFAEVRARPVRRVEQFKPQAGVARQSLRRGLQAGGVQFVGGNEHVTAIRRNFVGDIFCRQTAPHRLRIRGLESGVEDDIFPSIQQGDKQPQCQPDRHRSSGEQSFLLQAQAAQKVLDLIEAFLQIVRLLTQFNRGDAKVARVFTIGFCL